VSFQHADVPTLVEHVPQQNLFVLSPTRQQSSVTTELTPEHFPTVSSKLQTRRTQLLLNVILFITLLLVFSPPALCSRRTAIATS
jgi:hypothetical protein